MNHLFRKQGMMSMLFLWTCLHMMSAQVYSNYLGTGHSQNISVSSSSTEDGYDAFATISGMGMDSAYMKVQASRFLGQATLGADRILIDEVAEKGFEAWIDEQMGLEPTFLEPLLEEAIEKWQQRCNDADLGEEFCEEFVTDYGFRFMVGWMQAMMTGKDLLRQKVALALSEIFVVSGIGDVEEPFGLAMTNYYDMLMANAFGKYEDLLLDVTVHPLMGRYLTHFNNPRTIPEANIRPDENYAREVMQLFSIGLFELNLNGTLKYDANGDLIPTYTNEDIKEFAKIFTGLGNGGEGGVFGQYPYPGEVDFRVPMRMYEQWHEPGEKRLLNGFVVPAGQSGMEDIQMTIQHLANHPNTAPFICRRLIQRLVKSNPSNAYLLRVSQVFEDNGQGVRGDLGAVVKAILLDQEARDCFWLDHPDNGKLREPINRYTHFLKAFEASNESGAYYAIPFYLYAATRQLPMFAPSVFNFFLPDYQPIGPIAQNDLVAPEFQIHNSSTSIGYINMANAWTIYDFLMDTGGEYEEIGMEVPDAERVSIDLSPFTAIENSAVLVDELALLLCQDQLSENTRKIILDAINPIWEFREPAVKLAMYLIMISPDYNVTR